MRISVNGRDINVEGETASYESIVSLAGMTGYPSMTYRWRDRNSDVRREGIPLSGDVIRLAEGMRFNVAHT